VRLSQGTLAALAPDVEKPGYDRRAHAVGIVHFGVGAFHRAHQAVYTDTALSAGDKDWTILGVSLRSAAVRDQLVPQDGLYTVTSRSGQGDASRLIGAIQTVLVGPQEAQAIIDAIAAKTTCIITFTVTEKGYHRSPSGGLDVAAPGIAADLGERAAPATLFGYLRHGLASRRAAGLPGLSLVSCDNLAENGAVLRGLLREYLDRADPALARWVETECRCPSTMVDRIVPATTIDDLASVERRIGLRDEGAVVTEPFSQWVIQDDFAGARPRWEAGGAQLVSDVTLYETAKLRMLNGAHSALAYLGLEREHRFVHEAVADPEIGPTVERLMREEAASSLPTGLDTEAYADQLLERFSNPALPHELQQIAMDGSQKIPQRWLGTLAHHQQRGRQCPAIFTALAAWIRHVRGDRGNVNDPAADEIAHLWRQYGNEGIINALFGNVGLFRIWHPTREEILLLRAQLDE
jgi:fructuronate reductase